MTRMTDGKIGVDITATNPLYTDATLPTTGPQQNMDFPLGDITHGADSTMWMFVQASATITQYQFVGIDENYQAAPLTKTMADDGWFIGIAQVAIADNDGAWVVVRGSNVNGNVLASCAADAALYTTSTAGAVDDSSGGQTRIEGIVAVLINSTASATNTEIMMTWPRSTTF